MEMKPANARKHLRVSHKYSKSHTLQPHLWPSSEMCRTKGILHKYITQMQRTSA